MIEALQQSPATEKSRREQVFTVIDTCPGQTKFWLRDRLGVGSGTIDRAIRQLLAAGLIGAQKDRRGSVRFVPLGRWVRGEVPPQGWEATL